MKRAMMLTLGPFLACASAAQAGAVAEWSLIAQDSIVGVGKKFPGEAAVYMGIVHATMYDAAVAISGGYRPYRALPVVPAGASLDAAVAAAAHRVLVDLFPGQQDALDAAYTASLAAIPDGQAKTDGIAAGEAVGAAYLDLPAIEGLNAPVSFVQPPPGPGVYEPTASVAPLGTRLPLAVPLALEAASQFRPDGPSPLRSAEYAADLRQVQEVGRLDSTVRTDAQTGIALFWTDHDIPQ